MNRSPQYGIARFSFAFFLALLLFFPATGQTETAAEIEVELSDRAFPINNFATLTVRLKEITRGELIMPQLEEIQLQRRGQSRQIKIINGEMSSTISYTYALSGKKEGKYTLPPVIFKTEGGEIKSRSIDFTILSPSTAANQQQAGNPSQPESPSGLAILQIIAPEKIYIGESVAVEMKMLFSATTKIERGSIQPPSLTSNGVVMTPFSTPPKQGREEYNGKIWDTLSWQTTFSAIREGKNSVSITADAVALLRQRSNSRLQTRTPFDDPLFDSFFTNYIRKPLHLTAKKSINVLPLPAAGRPENFSGAVGDFDISAATRVEKIKTGEPLLLQLTVNGAGNFTSIDMPKLPQQNRWKTYPPRVHFEPIGDAGGGQKIFEQAVIVKDPAVTEIPALELCYFDPQQQRYITKKSAPIPLKVTGGSQQSAGKPSMEATTAPAATAKEEEMLVPRVDIGTLSRELRPLPRRPWFQLTTLFLLLLVLAVSLLRYYLQKKRGDREGELRKKRARRLQEDLVTLHAAKENNDSTLFLNACRIAIQNSLAARCDMHPSVVSLGDIRRVLPDSSPIIDIFSMADSATYGDRKLPVTELESIYTQLKKELESLL